MKYNSIKEYIYNRKTKFGNLKPDKSYENT